MKDSVFHVLIIVLIIGSTLFLAQRDDKTSVVGPYSSLQRDTISVSGQAEYTVAPDEAEIVIVVETDAATAKEAQDMNSDISNNVVTAVIKYVSKEDIETVSYYLTKMEYYNPQTGKPTPTGYRQSHTMKITLNDLDAVGDVIDAATNAGANRIQGVSFVLSDEKKKEANTHALQLAAHNAQNKATALADALDVDMGEAMTISETNYFFIPRSMDYGAGMAETAMQKTEILPQDVTISLSVNVVFEIE